MAARRAASSQNTPFMALKSPNRAGEGYVYVLEFIEEIRTFTAKTGPNAGKVSPVVDVFNQAIEGGDTDFVVGERYTLNLPTVLKNKLEEVAPLKGKKFEIVNLGKPSGKVYFDFFVKALS